MSHRVISASGALGLAVLLVGLFTSLDAQQPPTPQSPPPQTPSELPRPDPTFRGNVGRTYQDSDPAQFPQPVQAPKGAPNVVLILIDDAGFGQFSTFGGGVPSPTMDKLAAEGLRYNKFHTTALCSPTRAALITGRNHHSAASGVIAEAANGLGFDYFYGFNAGDMNHWNPVLYENRNLVPTSTDPKYFLTDDLADHAVSWVKKVKSISPDRPYFLYVAPGATHSPHH